MKEGSEIVFSGFNNTVTFACYCTYDSSNCFDLHFFKKGTKLRIADFVHGVDGPGNQNFPPPKGKQIEESAVDFLIRQAKTNPGKVIVVALGPLTNIALAIQQDLDFSKNIGQIVLLGGAFAVNDNVNPASEANIFGNPNAVDVVFKLWQ
ncbi:hypothetical protein K1719_033421 [Acacia pycnantha]|nr:hypothetical protein K1719_033421 [Acacia pycnantha]